ncbi:LysM peptidoglycan-binding domain-containing protein [Aeromonas jandaei]|uniref:hypothetical protein n=1 Tax=Aeromonas jandaei TaxID=650 RepID=UPI002AA0D875|nr:hypothetical protein [Aeromonas jandaei]
MSLDVYFKHGWTYKAWLGLVVLTPVEILASGGHLSIIDYDEGKQILSVNVVAEAIGEQKVYLNSDGMLSELQRFSLSGEHTLQIFLPCDDFDSADHLVYKKSEVVLTTPLSGLVCQKNVNGAQTPKIFYKDNGCFIEPRKRTLWRISSLLSEKNGYSVYQNLYAVFLFNPDAFIDNDIFKMNDVLLSCPPEELISSIDKKHGIEMFRSAEQFKLANQEKSKPQGRQEGLLALDVEPESEVIPVQPDDELLLDNVETALVSFNMDEQPIHGGGETLIQEEPKHEDGIHVASVDVIHDVLDKSLIKEPGDLIDNNLLLAGTMTSNDEVRADKTSSMTMTIQPEQSKDSDDTFDTTENISYDLIQGIVPGENIQGPKNNKSQINSVGCYIEPENRTLWRISVMFSQVNGYSVYQNAHAIYNVNPKAFPTNDINRMLNEKLSCPSIEDVARYSIKQSIDWFKTKIE